MNESVSVPVVARASDPLLETGAASGEAQRTAPLSVVVGLLNSVQNAAFPAIAAAFGSGIAGPGLFIGLAVGAAIIILGAAFAYVSWLKLTYTIGTADIRLESGLLSRSARSVPYERIQDVSLEQKLIPRLLGLVAVKFETGSGGGEDIALAYLNTAEGERLRELVRERRDEAERGASEETESASAAVEPREDAAEALFTMGPQRLFTFGLFEFSLAVFAVLAGLAQYADMMFNVEVWDFDLWRDVAEERGGWLLELGALSQIVGGLFVLAGFLFVGSATGMVRVFNREWGFLLERTARGFRRRRGLFTKTDVVMPIHRVQALTIGTRLLRYRFGWHSLRFVSLAQDAGSASHVVAPFAQLGELAPIVTAAGFDMPRQDADWHLATNAYRNVSIGWDLLFFAIAALAAGTATTLFAPEWTGFALGVIGIVAALDAIAGWISWRFKRHALDAEQIVAVAGVLAPTTQIATRVKLHSVEISQGPLARHFGFATLHLGLAGGEFSIPGIPIDRARAVRAKVLETIAATDFSQLESQSIARAGSLGAKAP
ncbi:MAG: PH domain-containing protein [Pseudomonadota bacterium]